tara:strand:+ start:628 stop:768 length:141 start_codon:yes stop_codon:yes gene_type:complete
MRQTQGWQLCGFPHNAADARADFRTSQRSDRCVIWRDRRHAFVINR